jgi:hypothetical protein
MKGRQRFEVEENPGRTDLGLAPESPASIAGRRSTNREKLAQFRADDASELGTGAGHETLEWG